MSNALVVIWLGLSVCTASITAGSTCKLDIIDAYASYGECLRGIDAKVKAVQMTATCISFTPAFVKGSVVLQPVVRGQHL